MRRVIERMHLGDYNRLRMTGQAAGCCAPDDPIERRVSSVGRAHPHVEIKIVDRDGATVPRGAAGELLVRGYLVMQRYWADEEKTAETIDEAGWLHTGDLATIDAEGYCNIVGRLKDMVIRGGENIYPREVEDVLYTCPDIEAAQAFGVPDQKFGEQLCVWIRPRAGATLTADDFPDYCRDGLAHVKVPVYVKFVDEFPMTVTGKVRKVEMRDKMCEELDLKEMATA